MAASNHPMEIKTIATTAVTAIATKRAIVGEILNLLVTHTEKRSENRIAMTPNTTKSRAIQSIAAFLH